MRAKRRSCIWLCVIGAILRFESPYRGGAGKRGWLKWLGRIVSDRKSSQFGLQQNCTEHCGYNAFDQHNSRPKKDIDCGPYHNTNDLDNKTNADSIDFR